jgi:ribose 5-phosphate isomerase B
MKIGLGSDHAGLRLKSTIVAVLEEEGYQVSDFGTTSEDSCDYPEFARLVAEAVRDGRCERGILVCATGVGMAVCANKVRGVRAGACNDLFSARYSRLHNDLNVLCLGERIIGPGLAQEIVRVWLDTPFEGGRHARRLDLIGTLENESMK